MCKKEKKKGLSCCSSGLGLLAIKAGGLGLIPCQGTRSHMPKLRVCILKKRLKISGAATKTAPSAPPLQKRSMKTHKILENRTRCLNVI